MGVISKQEEKFLKGLGERIASIRKQKRMKQVELGFKCDIEKPNMRRIEAGNTNPTILTLRKICVALGIELEELFHEL